MYHNGACQQHLEDSGRVGWQFIGALGDSYKPPLSESPNYKPGGKGRNKPQSWPLEPNWSFKS